MTDRDERVPPPALSPGDVFLYAHANGAIFLLESDHRSRVAPLDEALDIAADRHTAGRRVRVGWDDAPLARDAVAALRARGVALDVLDGVPAPQRWHEGTTALMEAAAHGNDRLLDDLVRRGATLHDRDASGSTALHHAAANGNVHAIDALVGAGLDPDDRNADGFTPYRLAVASRHLDAARRLGDLGADTGPGTAEAVTFPTSHRMALLVWLVQPVLSVVAALIVAATVHPVAGLGIAALALLLLWRIAPPRAFFAGGAPRRLDGTTLTIQGLGRPRDIDLRLVTGAAIGGSTGRQAAWGARWIVLDHPEGAPASPEVLRRLLLPPAELEAVAARFQHALVVPVAGGGHAEVVRALGNVLSGLGVDLSASLGAQLARARSDARRGPTPWWRR